MRAFALVAVAVLGCSSKSSDEHTTGSAARTGSAATPVIEAPVIDEARLVGAIDGCSAIAIQYGPYRMQPGGGLSPEAKRCAAVIIDEAYRRAAIAFVDKRCTDGMARACYVAGALRTEFVTSIGIGPATTADAKPRFVVRTFKPHSVDTQPRFATPEDQAEATRLFARACELGDVDGCARPVFDRANAGADATEIIAFACKHGSDYACQLQTAK